MEKIKKILIILFIIIVILILLIIFLLKNQKNDVNNVIVEDDSNEFGEEVILEEDNNGYTDVSDAGTFFSVVDVVKRYEKLCKLNIEYASSEVYINEDEYLLDIKNEEDRKNAIYNLLDKQYVKKNKITTANIDKYVYNIDTDTILLPKRMKVKYGTKVNTYIYEAYLIKDKDVQNKYFIVRTNNANQTFSLEFVNQDVGDILNLNINENNDSIENMRYNNFDIDTITIDEITQKYFENYKELVMIKPEIIYENYLEDEYKQKRYGSVEEYNKYVKNNIEQIETSQITKYVTNVTSENKIEYVCMDQYENTYIFDEDSTMQYKIKFDNYTIPTEKFISTYNEATDEQKIQMNVDKFVQMINRQDYRTSYAFIDDGFKNNYFKTNEEFEEFIKNKFYLYNSISFKSIDSKGNNTYVVNVEISDITEENLEKKAVTIVMQLKDNMNFVMAFGM